MREEMNGERKGSRCVLRFVSRVDASGIIYDVQRQYVSQISIGATIVDH